MCGRSWLRDANEKRWTHRSDSRFKGWGVSRTRNFGLWNLYSSELDDLTVRECLGDIRFESGSRTVDPVFGVHSCLQCFLDIKPHPRAISIMYGSRTAPGLFSFARLTALFFSVWAALSSGSNYVRMSLLELCPADIVFVFLVGRWW